MKFAEMVDKSYPTGSRYICDPAPTDTDHDILILVNGFYPWQDALVEEGWELCGKDYENNPGGFAAYRKGEDNYIVTEDETFFQSYVQATEGAKALNLLKKEDRIALFHAVLENSRTYKTGLFTEKKEFRIIDNRLRMFDAIDFQAAQDRVFRWGAVGLGAPRPVPPLNDNF